MSLWLSGPPSAEGHAERPKTGSEQNEGSRKMEGYEENKGEEELDEPCESFDENRTDSLAREERVTSRAVSWARRMWSSLQIEERRVSLADLLKLFLYLVLAMTLVTASIGLIRFSLTREGAIFWLIVCILIVFTQRHRIFRH